MRSSFRTAGYWNGVRYRPKNLSCRLRTQSQVRSCPHPFCPLLRRRAESPAGRIIPFSWHIPAKTHRSHIPYPQCSIYPWAYTPYRLSGLKVYMHIDVNHIEILFQNEITNIEKLKDYLDSNFPINKE